MLIIFLFPGSAIAQPSDEPTLAPLTNEAVPTRIPRQYIVVFKSGAARTSVFAAQEKTKEFGGKVLHTYTTTLSGFSVILPENNESAALQALRALSDVEYIEADQMGKGNTVQPPNPPGNPPTGLDRIDRRLLPLNQTYTYSETGTGVHAYVIDSGIRITHNEFGGRAIGSFNTINDTNGTNDCHGHGTNVAGIIGAKTYGIAKQVTLHAVRVLDCNNRGVVSDFIAGVEWVANNVIRPAVANMSLTTDAPSAALDTAVTNSITSGITYILIAGNNSGADACNISPARVAAGITVGNIDPSNDTRASTSNIGSCIDLFAPGVNILSAGISSDTATSTFTGTSQAAPHVAGVAARYLETHPTATPAEVWSAIHNANNVSSTPGWAGVLNRGIGSPNELLHWGSLNDGFNDGDPHITTIDGVNYDFQSAGEFIALRDEGFEIQTRQTPISTTFIPGANPYTGLATCVSINTAIAARVGTHRVSYQPNISGMPDPSGLQLRVDGELIKLDAQGLDLGSGGRIVRSAIGEGIEIDFPNKTKLIATPGWWADQGKWYLNVDIYHTPATEGIMGYISRDGWLPTLPDGTSVGSKPDSLHDRYIDLYEKFADAWRVTDDTSLFDYAPNTSTSTFTFRSWPKESPSSCVIPEQITAQPIDERIAERHCSAIIDKNRKANCIFDVRVTGNPGFAQTYLLTQQLEPGATKTTVTDDRDPTQFGETVIFTATVAQALPRGSSTPSGSVQFIVDGDIIDNPFTLDQNGQAVWSISNLPIGNHIISANYSPSPGSLFLASSSPDENHSVLKAQAQYFWWIILLLIVLLLIIIWRLRK